MTTRKAYYTNCQPSPLIAQLQEWFSGKIQRCHRWAPVRFPVLAFVFACLFSTTQYELTTFRYSLNIPDLPFFLKTLLIHTITNIIQDYIDLCPPDNFSNLIFSFIILFINWRFCNCSSAINLSNTVAFSPVKSLSSSKSLTSLSELVLDILVSLVALVVSHYLLLFCDLRRIRNNWCCGRSDSNSTRELLF